MMKTVLSLLLAFGSATTVPLVVAQESREGLAQRLGDLYGSPVAETFLVPGEVLIQAQYSEGGLACSLRIERASQDGRRVLPLDLAQRLLDEFVPPAEQQRPSRAIGLTGGACSGISWKSYPLVTVSRTSSCDESGETWLQRLEIQYKTQPCRAFWQAGKGAGTALEPSQPEEPPQWTRWTPEDLRALYGPPLEQSFAVSEGAVLKASLGDDWQPCRMQIEKPTLSRSALLPEEAEKILAGLPPLADAGPPLERSSLDVWECVRRDQADYADFSVEVENSSCASSGGLGVTRIVVDFVSDQCPAESEQLESQPSQPGG